MTIRLGFIGLGVMGYPMAGHLCKAGHPVRVFNRTAEKAAAWAGEYGGESCKTPREVAEVSDMVFTCVGNDDDLRQVVYGETGILSGLSPGSIFVDHTTTSALVAREIHQRAGEQGVGFLDAPVSGGQAGAQAAGLSIMVGGDAEVYERARPVLDLYGRTLSLIGGPGTGQLCKMVNQICIAGLVQGLAEALHFADNAELDIDKVMPVISGGAAQSWQMENRWQTMVAGTYEHGFAVDWMRKDLGIALQQARETGTSLPVTALVDQFYGELQQLGGGRWDTSSLLKRLQAFS